MCMSSIYKQTSNIINDKMSFRVGNISLHESAKKIADHVIKHIIAFSIVYYSSNGMNKNKTRNSNISIIHDDCEIEEIANKLLFLFDENDLKLDIIDVPFITCPCKIYNNRCNLCTYTDNMLSINNFQRSAAYNMYILTNNITKTYFLETSDYLLDRFGFSTKTELIYFSNWNYHQKSMLQMLIEFIADNWKDIGKYDKNYKCPFELSNFGYMHRINSSDDM